jgi:hypothetical protein
MEIAVPMPSVISRLQRRFLTSVTETVEEWTAFVPELTRWEDEHLLDNPTPELLADHKATVEGFLSFGQFLSLATERPDFPDRRLAEMVAATMGILQDKLRLWHGPRMTREESDRILAACFPDEP